MGRIRSSTRLVKLARSIKAATPEPVRQAISEEVGKTVQSLVDPARITRAIHQAGGSIREQGPQLLEKAATKSRNALDAAAPRVRAGAQKAADTLIDGAQRFTPGLYSRAQDMVEHIQTGSKDKRAASSPRAGSNAQAGSSTRAGNSTQAGSRDSGSSQDRRKR